ncbi:ribonuclease Y [Candidatus Dependentiae bacterium]|nr:ribonuclease Y [Candidatus Dependentiae bacterium]
MVTLVAIGIVFLLINILFFAFALNKNKQAHKFLNETKGKWESAKRDIENEKKDHLLKLKDEIYKKRIECDLDIKREKSELERFQSKINAKYDSIEKKELRLEELHKELQQKERQISRTTDLLRVNEQKLKTIYEELLSKLENISQMNREDAKKTLFNMIESEVRLANEKYIQKLEDEARTHAKEQAIDIIVNAMQRYTADQVSPVSSGVVHLPNDEMKGRIIGKEGRNIKSLELATGMEFVIGDTPEVITISGFNPIRREVARRTLEKLIVDGRINPTRIEETVHQCEKEIEEIIEEHGKEVVLKFNLQNIKPEIINLLGKLHFRTSFSQNVLTHSVEVALFARMIAEELGLPNPEIALRGGLLHDIGKAVSAEVEGPHALIGADIAKRCGEDLAVVNAIGAHHEEIPFTSIYSPIVMIADTISACRPGARRETLSTYIKRLEKLEEIAYSFGGIKKAYALQAGREVRIIVEEDLLNDEAAMSLAREIARKVEVDMNFPGQIKINVIREKRSIEYAK